MCGGMTFFLLSGQSFPNCQELKKLPALERIRPELDPQTEIQVAITIGKIHELANPKRR
jgi:hypothetical protein